MNILENYKQTLSVSNKKIKKHRSINEDEESTNVMGGKMKTVATNAGPIIKDEKQEEDSTGNNHVNNFIKANQEKKNKDVISQVDRVENGIDRMHKVIEKLRKIIHELRHTYYQSEYPSNNATGSSSTSQNK